MLNLCYNGYNIGSFFENVTYVVLNKKRFPKIPRLNKLDF